MFCKFTAYSQSVITFKLLFLFLDDINSLRLFILCTTYCTHIFGIKIGFTLKSVLDWFPKDSLTY